MLSVWWLYLLYEISPLIFIGLPIDAAIVKGESGLSSIKKLYDSDRLTVKNSPFLSKIRFKREKLTVDCLE